MRNIFAILIMITAMSIFSCEKIREKIDSTNQSYTATIPVDFIKTFEGQINNKFDIEMKIISNGGNITGTYFYKKAGGTLVIKGSVAGDGTIKLNEFDAAGNLTGLFEGKMPNENKIEGIWSKSNGQHPAPFYLLASNTSYESTQKEALSASHEKITGVYTSTSGDSGKVEIKYIGNNQFTFEISYKTEHCADGPMEGTANIDDNGIGRWSGEGCESLLFKFSKHVLNIEETKCDLHAMRCPFQGTYKKK